MHKRGLQSIVAAIVVVLFTTAAAHADSVSVVTSLGGLSANDTIAWSQLGADATDLSATPAFTSTHGLTGSVTLAGAHSLIAVVCAVSPCSWNLGGSVGFSAGDSLIWTADTGNSGNGPLTVNFTSKNVTAAGAFIQADGPAQFTAQIQPFNGVTSLGGPFTIMSDVAGDATFIGVIDNTGANITSVVFSITSCTGDCTDFALDTVSLNVPAGGTPTATATATATHTATATATATGGTPTATATATKTATATATRTATATATATATGGTPTATPTATATATSTATPTPTSTPTAVPGILKIKPTHKNFGKVTVGHVKSATFTLSNPAKSGPPITFASPITFSVPQTNPQEFGFPPGATNCPQQLFPKKKCKVKLLFGPATTGLKGSTLTILDNATGAPQTVTLTGTGK